MSKTQQTGSGIHKDRLLNFFVNSLDEEVALTLGEDAELDVGNIYEVLVSTYADETSVSTPCERNEDAPHENSVLYHFRTRFDLETLKQVGNMLLQRDVLDVLSQQVEICVDFHLRSYYGDGDDTDGLYHSQVKHGTTTLHAYATLYVHVKNKRYTLAMRCPEYGDTASSVLAELLGTLGGLDPSIKAVYLGHKFYDSKCLTPLQAHNHAYAMPIVCWERTIGRELPEGQSRAIQRSLTAKLDGHSWTVEFPVYIDCTYQNGRYDEYGVARHGYAADTPFTNSPRGVRYHYAKRSGIETGYRLSEQSIVATSTQNPVVRLSYVVVDLLLQNVWRYLHWEYMVTPHYGGRRPWEWSFKELVSMAR